MSKRIRWLAILAGLGAAATLGIVLACNPGGAGTQPSEAKTPIGGPADISDDTLAPGAVIGDADSASVVPDPDFQQKLNSARLSTRGWRTDFSLHTVPFDEISSGGPPRDGIPPLDNPNFTAVDNANVWLDPQEPVIFIEINGDARAYPIQILTWHEIANDVVGGVPISVTFCPLCNSAIVFDRRLDGRVLDFGTSGNLRFSYLIMWDRQTETWWQQFTGEGIVGELTGRNLTFLTSSIIAWEDFAAAHPDGQVLSRETGFSRPYGRNPYAGYDRVDNPPFLFDGELDGQLLPKERVATVTIGEVSAAFPVPALKEEGVVNYTVNGQDLAVFFNPGAKSAFLNRNTSEYDDVGATGVFDPNLGRRKLTFKLDGLRIVDDQTGSVWNIIGQAIEGPLAGEALTEIVHGDHFWFAWAAFRPDTLIYPGAAG